MHALTVPKCCNHQCNCSMQMLTLCTTRINPLLSSQILVETVQVATTLPCSFIQVCTRLVSQQQLLSNEELCVAPSASWEQKVAEGWWDFWHAWHLPCQTWSCPDDQQAKTSSIADVKDSKNCSQSARQAKCSDASQNV